MFYEATWLKQLDPAKARAWREIGWEAVLTELYLRLPERDIAIPGRPTSVSGRRIMSCCFHEERTPSLSLYPNGGFTCYGCGASGGIPDFVAELLGLSSMEQLERFFAELHSKHNLHPQQQRFTI